MRPGLPARAAMILCATIVLAIPAGAEGIAFAEAPEQASGVCFGDNPVETLQCARRRCTEAGAEPGDCHRVRWCYPAGWSADIFLQHKEGPHWHEYLCGWESREAVMKATAVACDRTLRPHLLECAAVRLWSPEGTESDVE